MCAACGTTHPSSWDRAACAAIGGRMAGWLDVHDPEAMCVMCGTTGAWTDFLAHLAAHHHHEEVPQDGRLVRFVYETRDLGRWES